MQDNDDTDEGLPPDLSGVQVLAPTSDPEDKKITIMEMPASIEAEEAEETQPTGTQGRTEESRISKMREDEAEAEYQRKRQRVAAMLRTKPGTTQSCSRVESQNTSVRSSRKSLGARATRSNASFQPRFVAPPKPAATNMETDSLEEEEANVNPAQRDEKEKLDDQERSLWQELRCLDATLVQRVNNALGSRTALHRPAEDSKLLQLQKKFNTSRPRTECTTVNKTMDTMLNHMEMVGRADVRALQPEALRELTDRRNQTSLTIRRSETANSRTSGGIYDRTQFWLHEKHCSLL